jgi:hypothetical protein
MSATPPPTPSGTRTKRGWVLPVSLAGAAVLVLCCAGAAVIVAVSGDTDDPSADGAAQPSPPMTAPDEEPEQTPDTDTEPEPEPEPEPEGFGPGVWEVGGEIPAGTHVTVVPGSGAFDSCYWARLSGFSGGLDDIIANDNLDAGARGRLEISPSDAGVEFTGDCSWVEVTGAPPLEVGDEVGPGTWAVGDEIQAGTYTTDAAEGDVFDSCYWARLSGFSGDLDDLIANDIIEAGSRGRVELSASDAGVHFTGDCRWTRN